MDSEQIEADSRSIMLTKKFENVTIDESLRIIKEIINNVQSTILIKGGSIRSNSTKIAKRN